jgi:hypothetical protein
MTASQPQLGSTPGFHLAVSRGRRHTPHHWCGFSLPFRPLDGLPKQPTTGRSHFVIRTGPSRQRASPQRQDRHWRHTYRQHPRRIPGPQSPSRSPAHVRHNTVHYIRTIPGPPVTCRPRRLAPNRLAIDKAEFDAMLQDGTARRSESSWSSALHIVPKKDNGWCPCGD